MDGRQPRHNAAADAMPILSSEQIWLPVRHSEFRMHRKLGDPSAAPTLRVDHLCGFTPYSEYVGFQGSPAARYYAAAWWRAMGGAYPTPLRVSDALSRCDELDRITEIIVKRDGPWWRINKRRVRRPDESIDEIDGRYRIRRAIAT
jgi:DNA repair protein RadD